MARMKDRARLDLLAKIGGGVDQEPALAIATEGQRRLGPRRHARVAGPRTATGFSVGVPLREAATGGGPQDDGLHGDRRRLACGLEAATIIRGRRRRRS